jgi:Lrp/AsnC family leucine-responsive transcriptional regulator
MTVELDTIDLKILNLMQANARISNADMARDLGMAASAVLERVKKLEQKKGDPPIYHEYQPGRCTAETARFYFY